MDIVERLRMWVSGIEPIYTLLDKAADEIERLRKQLNQGQKLSDNLADEIDRLIDILAKIKFDVDQARHIDDLHMDWVDDLNSVFKKEND